MEEDREKVVDILARKIITPAADKLQIIQWTDINHYNIKYDGKDFRLIFYDSDKNKKQDNLFRAVSCLADSSLCYGVDPIEYWGLAMPRICIEQFINEDKEKDKHPLKEDDIQDGEAKGNDAEQNKNYFKKFFIISPVAKSVDIDALSNEDKEIIARTIPHCLAYAHSKSIMHRNIDPDSLVSITINGQEFFYVSNWENARHVGEQNTQFEKYTDYQAPEIKNEHYDQSVDVYSYGMILNKIILFEQDEETINNYLELTELAKLCASDDPKKRPTFEDINRQLERIPYIFKNLKDEDRIKNVREQMRKASNERVKQQKPFTSEQIASLIITDDNQNLIKLREIQSKCEQHIPEYVVFYSTLLFTAFCVPLDQYRALKIMKENGAYLYDELIDSTSFTKAVHLELNGDLEKAKQEYLKITTNEKESESDKIQANIRLSILNRDIKLLGQMSEKSAVAKFELANALFSSKDLLTISKGFLLIESCIESGMPEAVIVRAEALCKLKYSLDPLLMAYVLTPYKQICNNKNIDISSKTNADLFNDYFNYILDKFDDSESKSLINYFEETIPKYYEWKSNPNDKNPKQE